MVSRRVILAGAVVAAAIVAAGGRVLQFHGEAKPGVHVLGVDVGGRSRSEIAATIGRWGRQRVTIHGGGHTYHVPRSWLVAIDAEATSTRALAAGSTSSLVVARRTDVDPVVSRAAVAGH